MKDRKANLNSNIKIMLRSLKYRNYRLYFSGQFVSLSGSWIQLVAMSWLVYRLTDSVFMLGLVSFLSSVPSFFFTPFTGVFADRWNKHKVFVITQAISMTLAFTLAVLTLTGNIEIWHIVLLSTLSGINGAFEMPVRQALVVELIEDRKDLGNAIGLNSTLINGTRLIGPAAGGIIVAKLGEGLCFLINGITFIAVIVALLFIRRNKPGPATVHRHVFTELKEGFKYSFSFPPIRDLIIFLAIISFALTQYSVLMPVFAKDILRGGSNTLGYLLAASGVGALFGSIYLASRKTILGLGRIMTMSAFLFSAAVIVFAFSRNFIISIAILPFTGLSYILFVAINNTILQTLTDDDMRGRVMSLFTMALMGTAPFGSLAAGAIAARIGAPLTIIISGIISLICGVILFLRLPALKKMMQPVYVKRGIIPEVAAGLQVAADYKVRS